MTVYVLTNVEAGWDCVRGVYRKKRDAFEHALDDKFDDNLSDNELEALVQDTRYVVHVEILN